MDLDLSSLRGVIAAADHGSFRQAAAALNLKQSALSRRIRQLEVQLGVSLFERSSGGVRLTSAGANMARAARRLFGEVDDMVASARLFDGLTLVEQVSVPRLYAAISARINPSFPGHRASNQAHIRYCRSRLANVTRDGSRPHRSRCAVLLLRSSAPLSCGVAPKVNSHVHAEDDRAHVRSCRKLRTHASNESAEIAKMCAAGNHRERIHRVRGASDTHWQPPFQILQLQTWSDYESRSWFAPQRYRCCRAREFPTSCGGSQPQTISIEPSCSPP